MTSNPHLIYAPIAGRAELTRLIAAAGGVTITESANGADFGKTTIQETGENKVNYMSPSGMPLLQHGDLKMSQSGAIEAYIASIAPRYKELTPQQRAVDMMFMGIKEEILHNCAIAIFTTQKADKDAAAADICALLDKWGAVFEDQIPAEGFIQGLPYPTPADLALLNITIGYMPFGSAKNLAGYDFGKWEKVAALLERVKADENVKNYLADSKYTDANPYGM
mmetsp:Transcript_22313/g.34217  ORF Transcript_22313/g.34217 Transcript_22313/m.34217 type:complete len:223 (+) Transcript_22313:110-778(+)|eukprot:CAMPEP_0196814820 /NCGR_PEP_ID=MMETSP1362-20130617/45963_1 /TAXON_ID=163516 /ORGANISM="Leptocylindrus danicus, Strain CCMP1856" /LENGTH=222 /DNA_ID=CAMNT_0042191567 /DNA_START=87 /DNA_END=755 /DNA_ORIENTATION=-